MKYEYLVDKGRRAKPFKMCNNIHKMKEFDLERLSSNEEEIMQLIWKMGSCSVRDILEQVAEPKPPYTTLASMVKNLERKGYLCTASYGKVYKYEAKISQEEYSKRSIDGIVQRYFKGSYRQLLQFFADSNKLSSHELRELIALIEQSDDEQERK